MEAIEFLKQHRVYEDETIYNSVGEMVGSLSQLMEEFAALRQTHVSGWLELEGNESVFNEYAKANCWCKFDDGTECRYEDEHPMAVMTHFRCK